MASKEPLLDEVASRQSPSFLSGEYRRNPPRISGLGMSWSFPEISGDCFQTPTPRERAARSGRCPSMEIATAMVQDLQQRWWCEAPASAVASCGARRSSPQCERKIFGRARRTQWWPSNSNLEKGKSCGNKSNFFVGNTLKFSYVEKDWERLLPMCHVGITMGPGWQKAKQVVALERMLLKLDASNSGPQIWRGSMSFYHHE